MLLASWFLVTPSLEFVLLRGRDPVVSMYGRT